MANNDLLTHVESQIQFWEWRITSLVAFIVEFADNNEWPWDGSADWRSYNTDLKQAVVEKNFWVEIFGRIQ